MKKLLMLGAGLLAVLAFYGQGNVANAIEMGIVGDPAPETTLAIGDFAPNFGFNDASGKHVLFHDVRGDVTILAIVGPEKPGACGIAGSLLDLANRYSNQDVDVRVMSISKPQGGMCTLHSNVVQQCGLRSDRIIGLCEDSGQISRLYKTDDVNVYFIVDQDGKITGKGSLSDLGGLRKCLAKTASRAGYYYRLWNDD